MGSALVMLSITSFTWSSIWLVKISRRMSLREYTSRQKAANGGLSRCLLILSKYKSGGDIRHIYIEKVSIQY